MLATTTSVVVAIVLLLVVYVFLRAVAWGVPKGKNYEIEVGLLPPKIKLKITDPSPSEKAKQLE